MRSYPDRAAIALVLVWAFCSLTSAVAQVHHGHVILGVSSASRNQAHVLSIDPTSGRQATILTTMIGVNCIRMSPDNDSLTVAFYSGGGPGTIARVFPNGTTVPLNWVGAVVSDMELDGDNEWYCAGLLAGHRLFTVHDPSGIPTTISKQRALSMAVVEEQGLRYAGAARYVVPQLFFTDRQGRITTMIRSTPQLELTDVELRPRTGELVLGGVTAPELRTLTQSGLIVPLGTFPQVQAIRVGADDTMWVSGFPTTGNPAVMRFDLQTQTVLTVHSVAAAPGALLTGLEIYGRRLLRCEKRSVNTIDVVLAANTSFWGRQYQLAASLGRRPGVRLPAGEFLSLDVTDGLFALSARNLAPTIFSNFSGRVPRVGVRATINLPPGTPRLGIPVFVSGVIHGLSRPATALNTHWFRL